MLRRQVLKLGMVLFVTATAFASSTAVKFDDVRIMSAKSEKDTRLVERDVDLIFDDAASKLTIKGEATIAVRYEDVVKVIAETTTHMKGVSSGLAILAGPIIATAAAQSPTNSYWFYFEGKPPQSVSVLLEVGSKSAPAVLSKLREILGERVLTPEFSKAEKIDKATFPEDRSKYSLVALPMRPRLPALRPDKALILIACPAPNPKSVGKGGPYKVYANDRVVAVNRLGTYSFAYVDPGEYLLASQTAQRSSIRGLRIRLDAGKDYYFLQDLVGGWTSTDTGLSMHSKELVLFQVGGAYYSDWRRKQ